MRKMLVVEPSERYNAENIYQHPFITGNNEDNIPLSSVEAMKAFRNEENFLNVKNFWNFFFIFKFFFKNFLNFFYFLFKGYKNGDVMLIYPTNIPEDKNKGETGYSWKKLKPWEPRNKKQWAETNTETFSNSHQKRCSIHSFFIFSFFLFCFFNFSCFLIFFKFVLNFF